MRSFLLVGAILGLLAHLPSPAVAQEKKVITTIDGVELNSIFYPSKVRRAPVVILLHAVGGSEKCDLAAYQDLAKELTKSYAVLTFDFRGHGGSKTIDPAKFTLYAPNKLSGVPAGGVSIEAAKFSKDYYPILINDIAAARSYLERNKNDEGECNTSNIILIGCDTGATLGTIWLNSEFYRHRYIAPMPPLVQWQPESYSEGKDISACMWLSISPSVGSVKPSLVKQVQLAAHSRGVPMVFMHAEGDTKGKAIASDVVGTLKKAKTDKDRLKYTLAYSLKGAEKLVGSGLLVPSLKTNQLILDYLDEASKKGGEWQTRDFRKSYSAWRVPNVGALAAKVPVNATTFVPPPFVGIPTGAYNDDMNLAFNSYDLFIAR